MKRLISLCLCFAMFLPTIALADNYSDIVVNSDNFVESKIDEIIAKSDISETSSKINKRIIVNEIAELQDMNIPLEFLIDIVENENGKYMYVYDYSGTESEITFIENSNGKGFISKEGNKMDEVIFTNDGKIILDGKEVLVTYENEVTDLPILEEIDHKLYINGILQESKEVQIDSIDDYSAERRSNIDTYYTSTCPAGTNMYGHTIDYDSFQLLDYKSEVANVDFGKTVESLTIAAFTNIISYYLFSNTLLGSTGASLLVTWYTSLKDDNPKTQYASYKDWAYTHYDGSQLTLTKSAWQHSFYGFEDINYAGSPVHIVFYEIKEYDI